MRSLCALPLLLLAGCVTGEAAMQDEALSPLARQQADPQLALMDHVLSEYFASDIASRPTVCASVSDGREDVAMTPEDERALIVRYEQLAPFSRCMWTADGWADQESEEPALVFQVHSFACASDTSCSAFAGYTSGNAASMSRRYTIEWRGGRWAFESDPRILMER